MERLFWKKEFGQIGRALSPLREALNELPQDVRQVFLLHRIGGSSVEQIACYSGRDPSAVEHGISQTIAHLERRLFR